MRDAEVNLESAKLALQKLQKPADNLSLLQGENAIVRAEESRRDAENDLQTAYADGFNSVVDAFLELPDIMTGLEDMLYTSSPGLGSGQFNIDYYAGEIARYDSISGNNAKDNVYGAYRQTAVTAYDKTFATYQTVSHSSPTDTIESLIFESYDTTQAIASAVKNSRNLIQLYKDTLKDKGQKSASLADTHIASLDTYTSRVSTHLANLLAAKNAIAQSKEDIVDSDRTIAEETESLVKLKIGTDTLDIASAQLTIRQRENALLDAKEALADYYIRAPFAGTLATVEAKRSDTVGSGTVIATLITEQILAEISLNEVDVAKVKVGQKADLTFDALPELTMTGTVSEIDTVGTVEQGVVTYTVKIIFDTQNNEVKPGMTANATIIIEKKDDVLIVPNSAVKTQDGRSFVQVAGDATLEPPVLGERTIETGLGNDLQTEVISGIIEGEQIVVRTLSAQAPAQTAAPSLFGAPGGTNRGGESGYSGSGMININNITKTIKLVRLNFKRLRREFYDRERRVCGDHGTERIWQIHADAYSGSIGYADHWHLSPWRQRRLDIER